MSKDGPLRIYRSEDAVITGCTRRPPAGPLTNIGSGRFTLVCGDGSKVVLEPGESVLLELRGRRIYRVACNDCGLSDGSHETWCPLWQPYVAEP